MNFCMIGLSPRMKFISQFKVYDFLLVCLKYYPHSDMILYSSQMELPSSRSVRIIPSLLSAQASKITVTSDTNSSTHLPPMSAC